MKAILLTQGRTAFSDEDLLKIIGSAERSLAAYQLCDGSRTQGDVADTAGINRGNFSRLAAKWEASGVLFRIGEEQNIRLLHVRTCSSDLHHKGKI